MTIFSKKVSHAEFYKQVGIPAEVIQKLQEMSIASGVDREIPSIRLRLREKSLDRLLQRNSTLLEIIHKQQWLAEKDFMLSYMMGITDADGYVIYVAGDKRAIASSDQMLNLGIGTSLAIHGSGTSSVSAAMEMGRTIFLSGEQHFIKALQEWECLCFPIFSIDRTPAAYLFLSSHERHKASLTIYPFLEAIVSNIEAELRKKHAHAPILDRQVIEERLKLYQLTAREMEIALFWIYDYDSQEIGKQLGISEHTVKAYIAKINTKLKVKSKASLILKVLGAI
jgi:DNA-binding CsgD family transcriptional regulator